MWKKTQPEAQCPFGYIVKAKMICWRIGQRVSDLECSNHISLAWQGTTWKGLVGIMQLMCRWWNLAQHESCMRNIHIWWVWQWVYTDCVWWHSECLGPWFRDSCSTQPLLLFKNKWRKWVIYLMNMPKCIDWDAKTKDQGSDLLRLGLVKSEPDKWWLNTFDIGSESWQKQTGSVIE